MSAATTIAFYGIRLDVGEADLQMLEDRSHPAIVSARKVGLQHYWGNFAEPGERYLLFVGKSLGKLGVEDSTEVRFTLEQLAQVAVDVSSRLSNAGFSGAPSLFVQFQPDT